jgi:GNAT superfamily N-acetyltransferase
MMGACVERSGCAGDTCAVANISVRPASVGDLRILSAVDERVTAGSERLAKLRTLINDERGLCLLAETDTTEVCGYVAVSRRGFFGRDFVELLQVGKPWRRRGIGVQLLEATVHRADTATVFTSTNESNEPMRRLLESHGWSFSGVLDGLDEGDPEVVYYWRRVGCLSPE